MDSIINLENVKYVYEDGTCALKDINLSIKQGEQIALLGKNGSGKSTLSKLINGLYKPTVGQVTVADMNTIDFKTSEIAHAVAYVFQNPDIQLFRQSIYKEVEYGAEALGYTKDRRKSLSEKALELTGLSKIADESPYDHPLFIRKLITVAAALVMDTDIIIMDEPTAGQDVAGKIILKDILNYLKKQNKTVIVISHDIEFVVESFQRFIFLKDGSVIADGSRALFGDSDTLDKANLRKPYITKIADGVGLKKTVLTEKEFLQLI